MAVTISSTADPDGMARAVDALRSGSVVALPTDTVYGLAVDPTRPGAVERLFAVKGRPKIVAIPVLVGTWEQVAAVTGQLGGAAAHLADQYWPGPLTLVVPRAGGFTADLGGPPSARTTVGVRWPDHPVVRHLCLELGPLAVTSANLHGSRPAISAREVVAAFSGADGLTSVLDGGLCSGTPSTVVECRGPATQCLREGSIPWSDILERQGRRSSETAE